jgi:Dolichyl-phosphate-mannose-protein mannosyltransferase
MAEHRASFLIPGMVLLSAFSLAIRIWAGARDLDEGRYWDEQYSFANVAALLDGSFHPANASYPGLSYLPEAAILAAVDGVQRIVGIPAWAIRSARIPSQEHFTPLAYFLCRLVQACFGTASLIALFCLARRHFTPAAGLAAALVMSAVPWHIRQSAIFKPDILLVLAAVLALDRSIRALRGLDYREFAWAGLWIGACAATKYNGVIVAVPLAAIAAAMALRTQGWVFYGKRLALAAAAALATFLVTNPFVVLDPAFVRHDLAATLIHYENLGDRAQASHWDLLANSVTSLLSESFHGPALGLLALGGLAAWLWRLVRLGQLSGSRENRAATRSVEILPLAVLASFPAVYVALYSAVTSGPSEHNWLPLVPVTSLAAADLGLRILARANSRLSPPLRPAAWGVAVGACVAWLTFASLSYARTLATPTTWTQAEDYLREALQPGLPDRIVYAEDSDEARLNLKEGKRTAALVFFAAAERPPDAALAEGDAEILTGGRQAHAARCRPGAGGQARPSRCVDFEPSLLRARGEALTAVVHPWRPVGDPSTLVPGGPRCSFRLAGEPSPTATHGSVEVLLGKDQAAAAPENLAAGGLALPLFPSGRAYGTRFFSTPRFPLPRGGGNRGAVEVRLRPPHCRPEEVVLLEWQ